MTKSKLYLFGLVSMMLINFVLIGFLWMGAKHQGPPPHGMNAEGPNGRPDGRKEMISNKIGFSESQKESYETLIFDHQQKISNTVSEMSDAKTKMYLALQKEDVNTDSILNFIGQKQIEIEKIHLQHFEDIKKICTKDQIPAYNALLQEIGNLFQQKGPQPKR